MSSVSGDYGRDVGAKRTLSKVPEVSAFFWIIKVLCTTVGETFADFITPLVLGVQDLLASQAYLNIVQFVDRRLFELLRRVNRELPNRSSVGAIFVSRVATGEGPGADHWNRTWGLDGKLGVGDRTRQISRRHGCRGRHGRCAVAFDITRQADCACSS